MDTEIPLITKEQYEKIIIDEAFDDEYMAEFGTFGFSETMNARYLKNIPLKLKYLAHFRQEKNKN